MANPELIRQIIQSLESLDIEAEIRPAPAPLSGDHVVAVMPSDSDDEPWVFSFTPMRDLEDELEDADLVQVMCVLPFTAEPGTYPDLARLLLNINNKTAVGAFALRESDGLLFYKSTLTVPRSGSGITEIVQNAFFLGGFLVEQFVGVIEKVVVERGALKDARAVRPDLDEFVGQ